jgi:antirestriction protein
MNSPRIYISSLADYNAGKLHGRWIDCDDGEQHIWDEIENMLSESTEFIAEDWAIHDYENWGSIKIPENENISWLAETAELIMNDNYDHAYAAYVSNLGQEDATPEGFQDDYCGTATSEEDFAYGYWEDCGYLAALKEAGISEHYIDWSAVTRDMFISDIFSCNNPDGGIFVFRNS